MSRNKPFNSSNENKGNQITFLGNVARAAHANYENAKGDKCESPYWVGYRDAMYHLARYIEDNEDVTNSAMINGILDYQAWAMLRED